MFIPFLLRGMPSCVLLVYLNQSNTGGDQDSLCGSIFCVFLNYYFLHYFDQNVFFPYTCLMIVFIYGNFSP